LREQSCQISQQADINVTDIKRADEIRREPEEQVRRREEDLRAFVDSIPQLAWMAHPDGSIFWYNLGWYEYTGTTLEQMQGWGWESVHDPQILPTVKQQWISCIQSGTSFEMEFPLRGADGVFRWFLTRIRPIRDKSGKITRWFGTNTNIDEQRQLLQSVSEAHEQLEKRVQDRTNELQVANDNLRNLSSRLLRLQDEERRRLARELHDSVGQIFAALSMNLGILRSQFHALDERGAQAIAENAQLIEQGNRQIRTISHLLHPPLLEMAGLATALRWYVDGFSERSKIHVDMEISADLGRLPTDTELAIFRIVQECLTNIHRHSGSPTATIRIEKKDAKLVVQVVDRGEGIPAEKLRQLTGAGHTGVGFGGIRERLRQLGGTLEIKSQADGTMVSAILNVP
jgi:PAS domain S-box-containing protein